MENVLVLTQYREGDKYNDFIGRFYHFPVNSRKNYLSLFSVLPAEFVYYEPAKNGKGEFYGYGRIVSPPFIDKNDSDYYFAEIVDYKPFKNPVYYKDESGTILEEKENIGGYNYNNAVRRISKKLLDNICLDGHIVLNFESDAHLVNILGEQLIGSEKIGILELIKNSIDASASYCKVRFEKVPGLPIIDPHNYQFGDLDGPVIIIEDDGCGMDRETIENGWLRPASTIKTHAKAVLREERKRAADSGNFGAYSSVVSQLKKEYGGRIPLGEKGVGRFATNRLGRKLIIRTKTATASDELVLRLDWDDFELAEGRQDLNKIGVELSREPVSKDYGERNSGTRIIIYGGRDNFSFDEDKIRDINRSIVRLNSPRPKPSITNPPFAAYLECPQIENLETAEIYRDFIPSFSLDVLVDKEGIVSDSRLEFNPPPSVPLPKEVWEEDGIDLRCYAKDFWRKGDSLDGFRIPECGPFFLHLDAWYRSKPWIEGLNYKEMLAYLSDYGGISIYRDNVLIFPAESGTKNDWLNLSQRNIKQGYRISYYNLIGNIELEQVDNIDLVDKTNREGLIENQAYYDLSKLVETIIQNLLEIRYIGKRDEYTTLTKGVERDPKKLKEAASIGASIIEGVGQYYSIADDPWKILERLGDSVSERREGLVNLASSIKNLKQSIELLEGVRDRLAEQAGFGLAAAVSIHELNKIATNFYNGITDLINAGGQNTYQLDSLRSASDSLRSELKRLSPLRTVRNEKPRCFKISQAVHYAQELFRGRLQDNRITVHFAVDDDIEVYARYSTLCQVFVNLIDNSVYWLSLIPEERRVITIRIETNKRFVIFADSGRGIDSAIRPYLFEAGYSMKIPPSGLGLFICKSYMNAIGGNIFETPAPYRLDDMCGAQFTIDFNNVPSNQ